MATSNRERIGQLFDLLAPALAEFIDRVLGPQLPDGNDWTQLVALKDAKNGITGESYSPDDPLLQLRMLTEGIPNQVRTGWYPFDGSLSNVQKSYASELRDTRNSWAHGGAFSDDDAYRALDTAERLLTGVNAPEAAEQVARIRLNLRRVTADRDDKRTLRNVASTPESAGLRPWREVLLPHTDVATGNFQSAEFAADLYKVSTGDPNQSREYSDPVEFFARTFLTEGLRDLVGRAVRRTGGDDNATPVVNLQTNFGGGKTHSMLALWHLAAGRPLGDFPQEWQELLTSAGYDDLPAGIRRVALVGNHIAPSGDVKSDGTKVNTLWGELAWQLGGRQAYQLVAASDAAGTAPGAALHELLAAYSPCLILIDEWVAYARQLYDRDDQAGGTFDTQFTFAQALTEATKATSSVLLAISIPASSESDDSHQPVAGSAEEVGGAHGLEALRRLQNVVRRVADQWRPASPDESYRIVRQRLFSTPDGEAIAAIGATARAFVDFYRRHQDDFPREARDQAYEARIRNTYPIHPELFDRLYEDWSSLERFQRTRGVLRLMNAVIHALWASDDAGPLILPGSIPLALSRVNSELTQYLPDSWKAVIDADVDGPNSEPARIDAERPLFGQRSLTKRLARTVFFGAAPTVGLAHKGLERQRVFLGTATPGDVPGNFHSALTVLGDRATYFYSGQGKYWYDLVPNISRRARDQAERLHKEDVWAEIARRLGDQRSHRGSFSAVDVCPESSADVPDTDSVRLVLLHPRLTHKRKGKDTTALEFAREATAQRGGAARTNRNMVVFLAADQDRMAELDNAVRDYLGWTSIVENEGELDLTASQKKQALEKQQQAGDTAAARLRGTFVWALVPDAPDPGKPFVVNAVKVEGDSDWLAERVSRKMQNEGTLSTVQGAASIRLALDRAETGLWADGHISLGRLWALYAEYPYMPRLRDRAVLDDGVRRVADVFLPDVEGFALASDYDPHSDTYRGLVLAGERTPIAVNDALLLVKPDLARSQRAADRQREAAEAGSPDEFSEAGGPPDGADDRRTPSGGPAMPGGAAGAPPGPPAKRRFFGVKELDSRAYAGDFKKVNDEVLAHLASIPHIDLHVRIEIQAELADGFADDKIRTVGENATTLRFEQSGFEES